MLLVPGLPEPASCDRLVLTLKQEVVEMERTAPMQTQEGWTSSILSPIILTAFLILVPYTSPLHMTQNFITTLYDLHHIAWAVMQLMNEVSLPCRLKKQLI